MGRNMKALVIDSLGGGRAATHIAEVPYPTLEDDKIIVKIKACSICKHCEDGYVNGGMVGMTTEKDYPIVLGHEFAGEVVEAGKKVTNVRVGDRVTVDNTVLCGSCYYCQRNEPLYCNNFGSMGHNIHGGMEEYVLALGEKAQVIPEGISYEAAACTEPAACCLRAIDRAGIRFGDNVAVLGAGSMGMILAQLSKASGANNVVVLASTQSKLDIIQREFGIRTVLVDRNDSGRHEAQIAEMFPNGLDVVFDSTGASSMFNSGLRMLGKGGRMVLYTIVQKMTVDDPVAFAFKELSIIMSWCQSHNYFRCLQAMRDGHLNLQPLVTHEFALDDFLEALDTNMNDRNSVKVIIHPDWEKGRKRVNI